MKLMIFISSPRLGALQIRCIPDWWEDYGKRKLETTPDAARQQEENWNGVCKGFETEFTPLKIKALLKIFSGSATRSL